LKVRAFITEHAEADERMEMGFIVPAGPLLISGGCMDPFLAIGRRRCVVLKTGFLYVHTPRFLSGPTPAVPVFVPQFHALHIVDRSQYLLFNHD
jgi:hypothetical protein